MDASAHTQYPTKSLGISSLKPTTTGFLIRKPRPDPHHGVLQLVLIVGEFELVLAGSGVDGGAIGDLQRRQVADGRIARAHQVAEMQVLIVEQVSNEALRNVRWRRQSPMF